MEVPVYYLLFLSIILNILTDSTECVESVCRTEACKKSAEYLKSCMNGSVNPCDNFYQFACGNFPNRDKKIADGVFTELSLKLKTIITGILEADIRKSDPQAVVKAKQLYRSCLDTDTMDQKGLSPLKDILRQVGLQTKPPFYQLTKKFDWMIVAAKMKRKLNMDFLITISVMPDARNRSVNRISIGKPSEYYLPSGQDYTQYLRKKAPFDRIVNYYGKQRLAASDVELLGPEFTNLLNGVEEVMNRGQKKPTKAQKKLAKRRKSFLNKFVFQRMILHYINRPSEKPVPKEMTLRELQNFTESFFTTAVSKATFNWEDYITTFFEDSNVKLDLMGGVDKILVYDISYLSDVIELVKRQRQVLEIAMWWEVISNLMLFTTDDLREKKETYFKDSSDSTTMSDVCQGVVKRYFGFAVAYRYLNDSRVTENQLRAGIMVDDVMYAFKKVIETAEWMDNTTKNIATVKASAMRIYISHPPWLQNSSKLDEFYENVTIVKKDFLKTILTIEQDEVKDQVEQLRIVNDLNSDAYISNPLQVNAFYVSTDNVMIIPMGIINFPFFGHSIQALNYGALGSVLGHEITHGFDTDGKRHDSIGNIKRWWENSTLSEYKKRAGCFVESYSQIEVANETVDGVLTLDENIADNGGLREAIIAYRNYVSTNGKESLLEGFENMTHEQLLTLSFASIWCEDSSSVSPIDEHSPNEARVIGVVTNSQEFASIWSCPQGSPMNPSGDKCRIW